MTAKYFVDAADLTLDQLDQMNEIVSTGKAGKIVATAYVALHAADPSITLEYVGALKQGEISVTDSDQVPAGDALEHPSG